jgi:hypothetical protein
MPQYMSHASIHESVLNNYKCAIIGGIIILNFSRMMCCKNEKCSELCGCMCERMSCWVHDGCAMGMRWVCDVVAGLMRCWSRWVAKGGVRGETQPKELHSPGHPETDILLYALRCMMFQAVHTELALMAQLANDMSTSQRSRVRIPRVATATPSPQPA